MSEEKGEKKERKKAALFPGNGPGNRVNRI
jgi:hypothetical protein